MPVNKNSVRLKKCLVFGLVIHNPQHSPTVRNFFDPTLGNDPCIPQNVYSFTVMQFPPIGKCNMPSLSPESFSSLHYFHLDLSWNCSCTSVWLPLEVTKEPQQLAGAA
jgi:hypothetical protein